MTQEQPSPSTIAAAAARLAGYGLRTKLLPAHWLSAAIGRPVLLKAEYCQPTGSFKVRGALNALLRQPDIARAAGVVTFSTGNHGRALAWAAARIGARCTVFVSALTPPFKQRALEASGATLVIAGASQDEAEVHARAHAASTGALLVPPFDSVDVISGQGTMLGEIVEDCASCGTIVVPVSGGGLAAGLCIAATAVANPPRVIGVSMTRGAAMHASLAAGRPTEVVEQESLADSLGGGVGGPDSLTFPIVSAGLADLLLVDEAAIAGAMVAARDLEGIVIEGAAATTLALALDGRAAAWPGPLVLIATGGNVDPAVIDRLAVGT